MYRLLATLLLCGLSQAATVFLSPSDALPSRLSVQQANLVLEAHLGLDQLFREHDFVGQGDKTALLLLVDEAYARDVLPSSLRPTFSFSESPFKPLPAFLETCSRLASHVYAYVAPEPSIPTQGVPRTLDLFSAPTPANEVFLAEASTLIDSLDAPDGFTALELTSLPELATTYGRSSAQYDLAVRTVHAAVEAALVSDSVHLALITYVPADRDRDWRTRALGDVRAPGRSVEVVPAGVLSSASASASSSSSCFESAFDCNEGTKECSGHGRCTNATRAGRSCFVCACTTTLSETGKSQSWAGERCERRDVSGPFVLIAGTVVTLILLIGGAVSLLSAIDSQELPSILIGGVAGGARRE